MYALEEVVEEEASAGEERNFLTTMLDFIVVIKFTQSSVRDRRHLRPEERGSGE